MEPPPAPFIIAPGEYTLYHEWGHHVDRTWSGNNQEISFSFGWLSRFYRLGVRPSNVAHAAHGSSVDHDEEVRPIESDAHASEAVVAWWHVSSELFADLFEDWMRGEKKVGWDHCEPNSLNVSARRRPFVRVALLPRVRSEDVRAETYRLFTAGIRSAADLPPVRPGLLGANTDEVVGHLRDVRGRVRAEEL
jgi:hypothetical protein